jgi:hypothetical protein
MHLRTVPAAAAEVSKKTVTIAEKDEKERIGKEWKRRFGVMCCTVRN